MITMYSHEFIEVLKAESGSIAICKPTKGKIYRHLLSSAKTEGSKTHYRAIFCVDLILRNRKAIRLSEQIFRNAAAIVSLHKRFKVSFSEDDLGVDINGIPISNVRRNKFAMVIEGYATD